MQRQCVGVRITYRFQYLNLLNSFYHQYEKQHTILQDKSVFLLFNKIYAMHIFFSSDACNRDTVDMHVYK